MQDFHTAASESATGPASGSSSDTIPIPGTVSDAFTLNECKLIHLSHLFFSLIIKLNVFTFFVWGPSRIDGKKSTFY